MQQNRWCYGDKDLQMMLLTKSKDKDEECMKVNNTWLSDAQCKKMFNYDFVAGMKRDSCIVQ